MTLSEALAIINARKSGGETKLHYLVCGFEPLHLASLFRAHLLERLPDVNVEVRTGLYGDLRGNIEAASGSPAIAAAVVLEWCDIDPRLGLRAAGGWSDEAKADILASVPRRCAEIENSIGQLAARMPVAISPPTLPLPPIGNTIRAQTSLLELELEQQLASFLLRLARLPGVRVVHPLRGDSGLDPKMELLAGFPYTLAFSDQLAGALVEVLWQAPPKKGLITDLDDTLWAGIVGEVGIEGVAWQQENHAQVHGLYQQMLGHLAGCGVLVGVATKNEPSLAEAAIARKDMLIGADALFPVCAGWGRKSASVARILNTWNIGAEAVVFIDDNPMELDEVRQAFPGITCLQFPRKDPAKVWSLLGELRDLFGKPVVMEEDRLRQASIRASAHIQEAGEDAAAPEFLGALGGTVTLAWRTDPSDKRPLELINKTNQFNLNGLRISEGEWQRRLEDPDTILGVISYRDKFGPLGKIAVILGARCGRKIRISHWVMSCRAFSRRLEHHTLDSLFRHSSGEEIELAFQITERNQPLREFFQAIGVRPNGTGMHRLSLADFVAGRGPLPHTISEIET